jgi:hypothetical protein
MLQHPVVVYASPKSHLVEEYMDQKLFREISHIEIYRVWKQVKEGGMPEDAEKARLGKVLKEHPQYSRYFELAGKNPAKEILDEQGANPFLHITLEAILENQLSSGEIPEVKLALDSLINNGWEEQEARHVIINAFLEELWHVINEKQPFNQGAYKRDLLKLINNPK